MAFRIHDSVVRGEIDNRTKGVVRGQIWVHGRAEPVVLELQGNARPDLAGCLLKFENSRPSVAHPHLDALHARQIGSIGDLTASRKVRVFEIPVDEALAMIRRQEKPPEHMANSLYLEWFSEANGRVVIESADYRLELSTPAWQLTPEEDERRAKDAAAGFEGFMGKLTEAVEASRFKAPEDRPMDEFEWEKAFRESDALTDKAMELFEKYRDHPDREEIIAKEMGWDNASNDGATENETEPPWDVDEINRICHEAIDNPPEPNPLTEGVDWVRQADGSISHPLVVRIIESGSALWKWCDEHNLLGDQEDTDLDQMIFFFQSCGAKCAGALGGLADHEPEAGFIVARLKRALDLLHKSLEASDRVKSRNSLPPDKLNPFREELFAVRQEILALMKRFRDTGPER